MDNTPDFEAFAAAFNDAEDYQADGAEETAETKMEEETAEEVGGEDENEPESGETDEEEHTSESEEESTEGDSEEDNPGSEQMFTIRVNKEDRQVGLAEMTTLAQKGADYDRVKGQLTESRQQLQDLQGERDKYRNAMDVLETMAAEAELSLDEFVEQLQVNSEMQSGKTESEAKAEIRAKKLEKQLDAMKAEATAKQEPAADDAESRAAREVAEFREKFPDVELTKELCNELMPDVQSGMSLSDAYQKRDNAQKDARIAELEKQLQAEKQNKRNRASSPGSQKDSGGKRERSEFDEFAAAFR